MPHRPATPGLSCSSGARADALCIVDIATRGPLPCVLDAQSRAPTTLDPRDWLHVTLDVLPHVYVLRTLSDGEVDGAGTVV